VSVKTIKPVAGWQAHPPSWQATPHTPRAGTPHNARLIYYLQCVTRACDAARCRVLSKPNTSDCRNLRVCAVRVASIESERARSIYFTLACKIRPTSRAPSRRTRLCKLSTTTCRDGSFRLCILCAL
jgi:hypothetical protein